MDPLTIAPRSTGTHSEVNDRAGAGEPLHDDHHVNDRPNESFIVEIFKFSILALVIVVPFRLFIAQPFIVSGSSMSPTFETGQYLIVDQITYRFEPPKRGDIVIFRYPNDPSKYFIKRIIGLPGEVVELANGETTILDPTTNTTTTLDEPYLKRDRTDDHLSTPLASDEYFVMGDNRGASSDSRLWGPLPRADIVGRALVRLLPPTTFALLPGAYVHGETPTSLSDMDRTATSS